GLVDPDHGDLSGLQSELLTGAGEVLAITEVAVVGLPVEVLLRGDLDPHRSIAGGDDLEVAAVAGEVVGVVAAAGAQVGERVADRVHDAFAVGGGGADRLGGAHPLRAAGRDPLELGEVGEQLHLSAPGRSARAGGSGTRS